MSAPTVTVITPTYNSETYIKATIQSVQAQSMGDWEMVIVDDRSTDGTCELVKQLAQSDQRIRLINQRENLGAGPARNRAVENARGRFIAYLDSDDIWFPEKLERQVEFMSTNGYGFTCTSYEVIDNQGVPLNKKIRMLPKANYTDFLTTNLLQTVGIMVDTEIVDKELLRMPAIKRRQDAATWLQILKAGHVNHGMTEVLGQYRRTTSSLSSNKIMAARGVWSLYREVEKLPLWFSCYCFVRYAVLAVWKRTYLRKSR
ncbi:glycosyl transferase [Mycobacterium sp. MS1601]|uniref:glycosyltransferase family 2 protein n=1 Tax=Mycobacterium sp. MS1601 TaxID=1936029 RepID=UPI0009796F50|nr:glycosyltransferase family 2 protein [Mycobacterium sp. MS1601]AQA01858.1 glycosyl transferase [Mycobacterium sp. MS1601]